MFIENNPVRAEVKPHKMGVKKLGRVLWQGINTFYCFYWKHQCSLALERHFGSLKANS